MFMMPPRSQGRHSRAPAHTRRRAGLTNGDVGPVDALLTGFLRDGHGGEYAAVVRGRGEGHGAGERKEGRERELARTGCAAPKYWR